MAAADYRLCDKCGAKCFYDANLNYDFTEYGDTGLYNLGDWSCICKECSKTHKTVITEIDNIVMRQYRHKETNKNCVDFGEYSKWQEADITKYNEIKEYIKQGYSYEVRELILNDA